MKKIRTEDISQKLAEGFKKVRRNLIAEEMKETNYRIIFDKNGKIIKFPARDLFNCFMTNFEKWELIKT